MKKKANIKKNVAFSIIRTLLTVAYPIITFSYVARILLVEDMGRVTFARNFISYFTLLATLGVGYYGVREGARVADNKYKFSKLFWEINVINICATVLAGILLTGVIIFVDQLAEYRTLLYINAVSIVLAGLSNEWVLSSREEYKYLAFIVFAIQIACIALIVSTIKSQEDYLKYSAILVISSFGSSIFNWIYIVRKVEIQRILVKKLEFKKHLKPVFLLFAMLVSIDLYTLLDTTMLGLLKGDYAVGIYNASIKIPRLVNSVIASVGTVLVPRLSYYYDENRDQFMRLISKAQEFIVFITVPAFCGILMMSNEIVMIFAGNQYTDAFVTTKILSPIVLIIPVSVLFNNQVFIPMRKEILVLKSTCFGATVNLTLNTLLIPMLAENGAAIATVVAELCVMLVCVYHVRKELNVQTVWKKYLRAALTSISIIGICLIIKEITDITFIRLFAAVMCSSLSYGLTNLRTLKDILSRK